MNAAVFSIFGATFPIFVIASALSVRTCGDKSMPYMAAALASMALSASIIASVGEHDMFARFFSLAAYGMAGVFMFAGATDKSWRSIDMLLLVVFVFMSSVIGGFFTRAPHSVVMPSAFVVFAGFAVMAIRYYANDKMLIALIMGARGRDAGRQRVHRPAGPERASRRQNGSGGAHGGRLDRELLHGV